MVVPCASLTKEGEIEYFLSRDGGKYGDGMCVVLRIISTVCFGLCCVVNQKFRKVACNYCFWTPPLHGILGCTLGYNVDTVLYK